MNETARLLKDKLIVLTILPVSRSETMFVIVRFTLDRLMFERNRMKVPELQEKGGVDKNNLYSIYNTICARVSY